MPPRKRKIEPEITTQALTMPDDYVRTPQFERTRAPYRKSTKRQKIDSLKRALKMMGVEHAVVSWAVKDIEDWNNPNFPEPGVAIWFTWMGRPMCLAADKWDTTSGNFSAVVRGIIGQYMMVSSGITKLEEAVISNLPKLLPLQGKAHFDPAKHAAEILELEQSDLSNQILVKSRVQELRLKYHPDMGRCPDGDDGDSLNVINLAYKCVQASWNLDKEDEQVSDLKDDGDEAEAHHSWRPRIVEDEDEEDVAVAESL